MIENGSTPLLEIQPVDGRAQRRRENATRLYDAAAELLVSSSFDDLSVEEICDRAAVGRATFFRIFGSKVGLLREFNRRLASDAERRLAGLETDNVRGSLGLVADAIVDAWEEAGPGHLGMARAFVQSAPLADQHAAHPELFTLVHQIVIDGIESGELTDSVPSRLAASLALIHLVAPVADSVAGRPTDNKLLVHTLLDHWYTGMTMSSRAPAGSTGTGPT